jgi:uncharacterized membrane protein
VERSDTHQLRFRPSVGIARRQRKIGEDRVVLVARRVTIVIHSELTAIVIILLCAAIMARGGWV